MTHVEMMQAALKELGEAPAEVLAAFLDDKYGVKIDPKFVPVLKASVREKELLEAFRQKRKATTEGGRVLQRRRLDGQPVRPGWSGCWFGERREISNPPLLKHIESYR